MGVTVRHLVEGAWLWQRGGRRLQVVRLGPPRLRTFLLSDPHAVRASARAYQAALSGHLHATVLQHVLRQLEVNLVLDVGANHGQYGRFLSAVGYEGRIVSYEPVSTNLRHLRRTASGDPAWFIEGVALGEVDTVAEINVSAGPGKLSSLLPSSAFGRQRFVNLRDDVVTREAVRVRRLDEVYPRAVAGIEDPRVLLKLDPQGYDLLVLSGAGEVVEDLVALQAEVSCIAVYCGVPHLTEQIAAYEDAGFAIAGAFPVTLEATSPAVVELDLLMVRRDAG